jgi:hypothetical protein
MTTINDATNRLQKLKLIAKDVFNHTPEAKFKITLHDLSYNPIEYILFYINDYELVMDSNFKRGFFDYYKDKFIVISLLI